MESIKLYFICDGISSNDIIDSINDNLDKNKSFFDMLSKPKSKSNKIERETFSKLIENGINELYMCQENKKNMQIFKKELNNKSNNNESNNNNLIEKEENKELNNVIYTSLEYSSIESTFVLFNKFKNLKIEPIPYISNKTSIEKIKDYDIFKKEFGEHKDNETIVSNYWKKEQINDKFSSLKNILIKIDWTKISEIKNILSSKIDWKKNELKMEEKGELKNYSILNSYNFNLFKKILDYIIFTNKKNAIFVCNKELIIDMLKQCKIKYNKNKDIIEYSSVWEIEININDKGIIYKNCNKIYPVKFNHEPLKKIDDNYSYKIKEKQFILFDSIKLIPMDYIKKMNLNNLSKDKKILLKKILNKNNINNMSDVKVMNNNNKKIIFENL